MNLPRAPHLYDVRDQQDVRNALNEADGRNYKKREDIDMDPATGVVMTSPNGTRYRLTVSNAGASVWTPL